MIDAEDVVFADDAVDERVELAGRGFVLSERLLDDDAVPRAVAPARADELHLMQRGEDALEGGRRRGEVEDAVAAGPVLLLHLLDDQRHGAVVALPAEIARRVVQARREALPGIGVYAAMRPRDGVPDKRAEPFVPQHLAGHADDGKPFRDRAFAEQAVQRRQQEALREIPRHTENDERRGFRIRNRCHMSRLCERSLPRLPSLPSLPRLRYFFPTGQTG